MGEGEEGVEEEGDEGDGVVVVGREEEEDGVVVATEDFHFFCFLSNPRIFPIYVLFISFLIGIGGA